MAGDRDALIFAASGDAALCTIVGIDGSFSRRCGAQLAIDVAGRAVGDLADNCLHGELAKQVEEARTDGKVRLLRYGKGSPFLDFRLPCGSGLDILVDPAPDRKAMQACIAALEARTEASLALPLPDNAKPELLRTRRYAPPMRLVILGAGGECDALERLASVQAIAVERREAGEGISLGQQPSGLEVDPCTAILLLFHDHEWEHTLLDWALGTPAFYIGAQGGAPAREDRMARLAGSGHDEEQLGRIRSPVGLIPRARDPNVLALSILADVVGAYEALHPHQ